MLDQLGVETEEEEEGEEETKEPPPPESCLAMTMACLGFLRAFSGRDFENRVENAASIHETRSPANRGGPHRKEITEVIIS